MQVPSIWWQLPIFCTFLKLWPCCSMCLTACLYERLREEKLTSLGEALCGTSANYMNESLPALMQARQRPLARTLCLEASVGFMEHATSMTRLSSCWLSESAQKLSHHVHMRTNDLRGLPYSEAGRASLSRLEGQGLQGTFSAVASCMERIL